MYVGIVICQLHMWFKKSSLNISNYLLLCHVALLQEAGPGIRDPTPCRRAAFQLTLEDPSAGGTVATAGGRHVLAIYILFFLGGLVFGAFLLYFVSRRRSIARQGHHLPDNSLSSEKGRDLLGSSATPQSPSSASLMSEGFRLTEKRNGTATTTTTTTLLSNQGNGGHLGNSYSGTLIHSNPSNGHGNSLYANCNTSSSGLKFTSEILDADLLDGRTGERERGRPEGVERESGEGDEVDEGLGDGLGEGIKGLEEEMANFPMFKSPAPLAQCEESSIWKGDINIRSIAPFCILQINWILLGEMQNGYCQMPLNGSCGIKRDCRDIWEIYDVKVYVEACERDVWNELRDRKHISVVSQSGWEPQLNKCVRCKYKM